MGYTTTDFLRSVRMRAKMVNASTKDFTNEQLYVLADEEIQINLVPLLGRVMQEYGIFEEDVALTSGKSKYRIPSRAIGGQLRDLKYVDVAGNEQFVAQLFPDLAENNQVDAGAVPFGYKVQANSIILVPSPNTNQGSLRFRYFMRPNNLVNVGAAGTIIDKTGQVLTVTGPADWASAQAFDILKGSPGFETVHIDLVASAFSFDGVATYTLTFASDVDLSEVEAGDYVCKTGETPVPQLPADMQPVLYQHVVYKIQEINGDAQARAMAVESLAVMEDRLKQSIAPRVQSAKFVIRPYLRTWLP